MVERFGIFWRIAHCLYAKKHKACNIIAKVFERIGMILCANEVSAETEVGCGSQFLHRGVGCVIHRHAKIGCNCIIFQNVTIGCKFSNCLNGGGVPAIGNNVMIGAGAVVLGGIHIGDNSIIGANAVVINDVPPNSIALGVPAKIRPREGFDEK